MPAPSSSPSSSPTTPCTSVTSFQAQLAAAMLADSPVLQVVPPRKRKRTEADGSEDDEEEDDLPIVIPSSEPPSGSDAGLTVGHSASNGNMLAFAKRYATHKRLKPSQIGEVEAFAGDSVAARQIKLFTLALSLDTKLDSIITATPGFKVSAALEKNLRQLAHGVMTSSRVSSYKGQIVTKHVLNIVKKNRFDLPPGIEFVASDWGLVKSRAEYHLTQVRGQYNKFLKASMPRNTEPKDHTNIFVLGQRFVKDCNTVLTVELCARIALMRKYFILFPGDNFWNKLDENLAWIRANAKYDETKIAKAFKLILNNDRASHGNSADYKLPEDAVVDSWQLSVDDSIDADAPTV
ncbi:hypothetical protein FB451DRAFT_1387367 [Mycena latifolia]|nr:hypothetical protein FB451DRAFT_1387367 [Mycena latifolia]